MSESGYSGYLSPYLDFIECVLKQGARPMEIARYLYDEAKVRSPWGNSEGLAWEGSERLGRISSMAGIIRKCIGEKLVALMGPHFPKGWENPSKRKARVQVCWGDPVWNESDIWTPQRQAEEISAETAA